MYDVANPPSEKVDSKYLHVFQRGRMIQSISIVELLINNFISWHYFQKHHVDFLSDFLESDYFGFELRIQTLRTILSKHHQGAAFPFASLRELQKIRNLVAHASVRSDISVDEQGQKTAGRSYYYHQGEKIDAETLFAKFGKNWKSVIEALNTLPGVSYIEESVEGKLP